MDPDQAVECKYFKRKSGSWELPVALVCLLSLSLKDMVFSRLSVFRHVFVTWGYRAEEAAQFEPCCWYILLVTVGATLCLFGMRDQGKGYRARATMTFTASIGVVLITAVLYNAYAIYLGYSTFLLLMSAVCWRQGDEYHQTVTKSLLGGIGISLPVLLVCAILQITAPETRAPEPTTESAPLFTPATPSAPAPPAAPETPATPAPSPPPTAPEPSVAPTDSE